MDNLQIHVQKKVAPNAITLTYTSGNPSTYTRFLIYNHPTLFNALPASLVCTIRELKSHPTFGNLIENASLGEMHIYNGDNKGNSLLSATGAVSMDVRDYQ